MVDCQHRWSGWYDAGAFTTTCYKDCLNGCGTVMMGCAGKETGEFRKRALLPLPAPVIFNGRVLSEEDRKAWPEQYQQVFEEIE